MNRDFDGLKNVFKCKKRNFYNFAFHVRNRESIRRSFAAVKPSLIIR